MKHPKPHHQDAALDTFVGNLTEISAILVRLQSAVDDHEGEYADAAAEEYK